MTTPSDGAAAALENYFQAANRASLGQDLDGFRALFAESCGICMSQYRNFTAAYADGQSATGTLYTSWTIEIVGENDGQIVAQTVLDTGDIELRDATGEILETFAGESGITTAWTLAQQGDNWLVVDGRDLA